MPHVRPSESEHVDLLLLDVMLPGANGIDLCDLAEPLATHHGALVVMSTL